MTGKVYWQLTGFPYLKNIIINGSFSTQCEWLERFSGNWQGLIILTCNQTKKYYNGNPSKQCAYIISIGIIHSLDKNYNWEINYVPWRNISLIQLSLTTNIFTNLPLAYQNILLLFSSKIFNLVLNTVNIYQLPILVIFMNTILLYSVTSPVSWQVISRC